MKFVFYIFFLFTILSAHAQGEANIWYFGNKAGLDFNSGVPVALNNGKLNTIEGAASICNANGQLLFYTDGVTVYNRNHQIMQNGTGLHGHQSTTQSSVIVPKPESLNLFYLFTLDEFGNSNGLKYSIIDINLDDGLGGVTSQKNVSVYSPSSEKLIVVKHSNNSDFWIVTRDFPADTFYSYLLTSNGLSNSPILSPATYIGSFYFDAVGYMRASSNGSKIALAVNSKYLELYDFNNSSGELSNAQILSSGGVGFYGVEFSPDGNILYSSETATRSLFQYNLNATSIPLSKTNIFSSTTYVNSPAAIQIGPDGKIYVALFSTNFLNVINNPNTVGLGCNIAINAVNLDMGECKLGLPNFYKTYSTTAINVENNCIGDSTYFQLANSNVLSASWNFGDGNTSNVLSPVHTYTATGEYEVSVIFITSNGTSTNSRNITIFPQPNLLSNTLTLKQCDDNNDGFSAFNLKQTESMLVAATTGLTFSYHTSQINANSNLFPISNPVAYTNQTVNNDVVFVRVTNANNCYKTAQINLNVSTTNIPASFQKSFTICDNTISGSATDGIATFNFSSANAEIQNLYPVGQQLEITYYKNLADALAEQNQIADISNYTNIGYPNTQNIYVRVDSQVNNECLGLGHHITLKVEAIPFINDKTLNACDNDQDGIFAFDTTSLQSTILNGLTNVTVTYTDSNGVLLPSPLPNPFTTATQNITVRATNNTTTACFGEAILKFVVNDLPEAFAVSSILTTVCDDESNPINQNGIFDFDTSSFQSTITGSQTGILVKYFDSNGGVLSSPLPNPFISATQNITVEVSNTNNLLCKASVIIPFVVKERPKIELTGTELICSNNPTFTKTIDAGILDLSTINNFTYKWFFNNAIINAASNYDLVVNTAGIYTVEVTNAQNCTTTRTITVTASNIATIENIAITDLTDINSVVITVSGTGIYEYSLDGQNYQTSNTFVNVASGLYTVYVKDKNNCGIAKKDISLLGLPSYFTPNGDGYNDYWNIKGVNSTYNAKTTIYIFDRYGKLLKQLSPLSTGWDGTFNGEIMPASDYWYSIQLEDGRVFKGHFTLKR